MEMIFRIVKEGCSYRELKEEIKKHLMNIQDVNMIQNKKGQNISHIICIHGNVKLLKHHSKFLFNSIDNYGNLPIYYILKYVKNNMDKIFILQKLISYGLLTNKVLEHTNYHGIKIKQKLEEIVNQSKVDIPPKEEETPNDNHYFDNDQEDVENSYFRSFEDDLCHTTRYESYDQWCDRIAREFKTKYSFSNSKTDNEEKSTGSGRKRKSNTNKDTISDEKSIIRDIKPLYNQFVDRFNKFCRSASLSSMLLIYDFPWPVDPNSQELKSVITSRLDDEKLSELCKVMGEIAIYGLLQSGEMIITDEGQKFIKSQRIFWHPDKFQAKYKDSIAPHHKELVLKLALNMSQLFNRVYTELSRNNP